MNAYLNKFSSHTVAHFPTTKLFSPMIICWSPLSYVMGPPLSPLLNQIIYHYFASPLTHLTNSLACLPPGADPSVLLGPSNFCSAFSRSHHRDAQLINYVPLTFSQRPTFYMKPEKIAMQG